MEESKKVQRKAAYSIRERAGKDPYWHLIGTAFVNKDGSLSLLLDSLPLDGRVHIRDFKEHTEQQ